VSGRDTQRGKLYAAENKARRMLEAEGQRFTPVRTEATYRRRIDEIMGSVWMRETYPRALGPVKLDWSLRKRGGANADPSGITTSITDFACHELVLLHELAHTIQKRMWSSPRCNDPAFRDPGHGPVYAKIYLSLVRRFVGQRAHDVLRDHFKAGGVRYIVRKAPETAAGASKRELPPALAAKAAERSAEAAKRFGEQLRRSFMPGVEILKRHRVVASAKPYQIASGEWRVAFRYRGDIVQTVLLSLPDADLWAAWKVFRKQQGV
jgi:putative metallohydrolase (TIGR04338 family)